MSCPKCAGGGWVVEPVGGGPGYGAPRLMVYACRKCSRYPDDLRACLGVLSFLGARLSPDEGDEELAYARIDAVRSQTWAALLHGAANAVADLETGGLL